MELELSALATTPPSCGPVPDGCLTSFAIKLTSIESSGGVNEDSFFIIYISRPTDNPLHSNQNKQLPRNSSTWLELWRRGSRAAHGTGKEDENEISALEFSGIACHAGRSVKLTCSCKMGWFFCFLCRCCVGIQASSLVTVLLGGERGRQDNPVSCFLFTRLWLWTPHRGNWRRAKPYYLHQRVLHCTVCCTIY